MWSLIQVSTTSVCSLYFTPNKPCTQMLVATLTSGLPSSSASRSPQRSSNSTLDTKPLAPKHRPPHITQLQVLANVLTVVKSVLIPVTLTSFTMRAGYYF